MRTLIAAIIGGVVAWAATRGYEVSDDIRLTFETAMFAVATGLVTYLQRALAKQFPKAFGFLDALSERKVIAAEAATNTGKIIVPRQPDVLMPPPEPAPAPEPEVFVPPVVVVPRGPGAPDVP